MPWKVTSVSEQRLDMMREYEAGADRVTALARKYGVSRKTFYKLLHRYLSEGAAGLDDRSRRPRGSPRATAPATVDRVVALRQHFPRWGSRKLQVLLAEQQASVPCERTLHRLLQRAGLVTPPAPPAPAVQRFERAQCNERWQLDFKSPVYLDTLPTHSRVAPLSILDDHSRFALGLVALPNQQLATLWPALWAVFGGYGLPQALLTDNANGLFRSHRQGVTTFTRQLWQLDIAHHRGRPHHPQTQGKVERWHGTLDRELLVGQRYATLAQLQEAFTAYRQLDNQVRPHEALGLQTPVRHYQPSARPCVRGANAGRRRCRRWSIRRGPSCARCTPAAISRCAVASCGWARAWPANGCSSWTKTQPWSSATAASWSAAWPGTTCSRASGSEAQALDHMANGNSHGPQ
jgi:transposase InsO family protein